MIDPRYLFDQIESLFVPLWTIRNKETINIYRFNHYKNNRNWQISMRIETFFPERGSSVSRDRRIARVGKKKKRKKCPLINARTSPWREVARVRPAIRSLIYHSTLPVFHHSPLFTRHTSSRMRCLYIYITMTNRELLQKINELWTRYLSRPH